jgi:phosphatidylserine decarboxylase
MAAQIMSRRFAFTFWKILNERCLEPGAKATKRSEDSQTLTTTPTGSPSLEGPMSISKPLERSLKGLFYCVLYLGPGDYHRIHSPSDWKIRLRRHFAGKLFPVNDRAVRTVRNLYVVNERVIPLLAQHAPPIVTTQKYGIGGEGLGVKAGDEVAVFNLGSTVVLVFEAPVIGDDSATSSLQGEQFRFLLKKGQRVKMGEAIGMW